MTSKLIYLKPQAIAKQNNAQILASAPFKLFYVYSRLRLQADLWYIQAQPKFAAKPKSKTRDYNFNPPLPTLSCMALQKQCGKMEGKRIMDRYYSQTQSIFDLES